MRIGHYICDLSGQGGIETYVSRLGQALTERGHDVLYFGLQGDFSSTEHICVEDTGDLYDQAQAMGVDVLHLHKAVSERPPEGLTTIRTVHDNSAACPSGTRYLKRNQEPCNRISNLPACLFGHYVDGCGSRRPHKVWENFQNLAANQRVLPAIHTITVSQYLKNQMIALGYQGDNIQVLRSPAPKTSFPPSPIDTSRPPRILFLGRLVPEKGVGWLLRAAKHLEPSVQIDIAGVGYHRAALEEQATELGLNDRVTFHGWKEGDQLEALFHNARVVAVPSLWHEPAGLVTLEAAAMGRPVVASSVGGIPEYADPSFSILVPPNDAEELANALRHLCQNPEQAEQMGEDGHAYVRKNYRMSDFTDRHEAIYARTSGKESENVSTPIQ